ncbi:hypothetical protein M2323_003908 [Rhodoblastus acidophilus]|nr:hypothetical protein [Rhodoblastus acidophilus]MCW2334965.1 hypothetical protein [Rhodoblastus acidophilus]
MSHNCQITTQALAAHAVAERLEVDAARSAIAKSRH